MELGTSFLKSKIARRFCILFLLCAFLPTVAIVYMSYLKVIKQLEEQSITRLQREASAYGFGLFDRMIRIDNELQLTGRSFLSSRAADFRLTDIQQEGYNTLFNGIAIFYPNDSSFTPIHKTFDLERLRIRLTLTPERVQSKKPFIFTFNNPEGPAEIYFCHNIQEEQKTFLTIIGKINPQYLWGIGPSPLPPPQTELSVFDKSGASMIASNKGMTGSYQEYPREHPYKDLRVFEYDNAGETYLASSTNLFVESRFQDAGWLIILSQAKSDVMAAMKGFKTTFPLMVLLLLLIILYLSVMLIRKGLRPLEQLKEGTQRIAQREFTTKVDITSNDEFQELGSAFNDMAVKLNHQFSTLNVLGEIDRAILSSIERPKVIATTLQRLKEFYQCDLCLLAKNSDTATDHIKTYKLKGRRLSDPTVEYFTLHPKDPEILFTQGTHRILNDKSCHPAFLLQAAGEQLADYLCLPLSIDGKINRTLILGWRNPHTFNEDELNQIRKITDQLAIGLTNSLHMENLEKLAMGTIEALARTVDAKSKWTAGHSERVAVLSGRIGKRLGLNEKILDTISRGGLLHDIGKIGIRLAILDKPDRLDDKEYEEIKTHPAIGGKILEPIKAFQDIIPIIVQHHEKYDGTGYPEGLAGEKIDLRARILAVADVWDALVSERPYREGWIQERAKKLIVEGSGSHFDPQVVDAFLAVIADS